MASNTRIEPGKEHEWVTYVRPNGRRRVSGVLHYYVHKPTQRVWFNKPSTPDVLRLSTSYPTVGSLVKSPGWTRDLPSCVKMPEGL